MASGMWPATWHDEGVDDRALIDAVLSGDRQAFGVLVERETRTVYRATVRILGRPQDAEDVTQESFVAALSVHPDLPGRGLVPRLAAADRNPPGLPPAGPASAHRGLDAIPEPRLADASAEPTRLLIDRESHDAVRDAVRMLPEPYREVVALRFFGELSLAEVAEATGRPINTVKTHLRRGLERLRPVLGTREAE